MRRNRRRLVALSVVSAINALLVYAVIGGGAALIIFLGFPSMVDRSWSPSLGTDLALAFVVGLVWLSYTAWATLHDLPADVSGGLGVRPPDREAVVIELIDELAIATGLPKPAEVGVIESSAPNALAVGVGVRRTSIVVTTGLVDMLSRDELEAVLATEMISGARLDVALRSIVAAF